MLVLIYQHARTQSRIGYLPAAHIYLHTCFILLYLIAGTTRAEESQGTPTQSHISPSILVYEYHVFWFWFWFWVTSVLVRSHGRPRALEQTLWEREVSRQLPEPALPPHRRVKKCNGSIFG